MKDELEEYRERIAEPGAKGRTRHPN